MLKWCSPMRLWLWLALLAVVHAEEVAFECLMCPAGQEITLPDMTVNLPWEETALTCSQMQDKGYEKAQCNMFQPFTFVSCGCQDVETPSPTVSPTASPTNPPLDGCWDDLDAIAAQEATVQDDSSKRTYILCPFTDYYMGRQDPQGIFQFGFKPITPRPNVHYKCGETGNAANLCRLLDGTYQIFHVRPSQNVVFEGLTLESAQTVGLFAAAPGSLTFLDCIFTVSTSILQVYSGKGSSSALLESIVGYILHIVHSLIHFHTISTQDHYNVAPVFVQYQQTQPGVTLTLHFQQTIFQVR